MKKKCIIPAHFITLQTLPAQSAFLNCKDGMKKSKKKEGVFFKKKNLNPLGSIIFQLFIIVALADYVKKNSLFYYYFIPSVWSSVTINKVFRQNVLLGEKILSN